MSDIPTWAIVLIGYYAGLAMGVLMERGVGVRK